MMVVTWRPLCAQETSSKSLIDFNRDVRTIFSDKCLACHGPDDAKNDFRIDDKATLLDYVEPGAVDDSMLWADYLVTDDQDTQMPPKGEPQLTGVELATIKLWIEEGAVWDDAATAEAPTTPPVAKEPSGLRANVWTFQGLFHPVSVHLPVALLSISALFGLLALKYPESFEAAAFHCFWIGAVGAVGACVTGWAYAQHQGYGGYSFDVVGSLVDRHRWAGILVAVTSVALVPLAWKARTHDDAKLRKYWLAGSILVAVLLGTTGNWGGELIFGKNHYFNEFHRLFIDDPADTEATRDADEDVP